MHLKEAVMSNFLLVAIDKANGFTDALGSLTPILLIVGAFAAMYFFMMRPQKKKEQKLKDMRENLTRGDRLTTIGGIFGRVVEVKDDVITLDIGVGSDHTKITIARWAVGSVEGQEKDGETLDETSGGKKK